MTTLGDEIAMIKQSIVDDLKKPMLEPGDITIRGIARDTGRSENVVTKYLAIKVDRGLLTVEKRIDPDTGLPVNVYLPTPTKSLFEDEKIEQNVQND